MKFIAEVVNTEHGKTLIPSSHHDQDQCDKLRAGSEYKINATKARNPDHHRKGFALINLIFNSQERYETMEDLLTELKLKSGWYREHVTTSKNPILVSMRKWSGELPTMIGMRLEQFLMQLEEQSNIVYVPKSISFADMDQLEFEAFYERLIDIAKTDYGLEEAITFI